MSETLLSAFFESSQVIWQELSTILQVGNQRERAALLPGITECSSSRARSVLWMAGSRTDVLTPPHTPYHLLPKIKITSHQDPWKHRLLQSNVCQTYLKILQRTSCLRASWQMSPYLFAPSWTFSEASAGISLGCTLEPPGAAGSKMHWCLYLSLTWKAWFNQSHVWLWCCLFFPKASQVFPMQSGLRRTVFKAGLLFSVCTSLLTQGYVRWVSGGA